MEGAALRKPGDCETQPAAGTRETPFDDPPRPRWIESLEFLALRLSRATIGRLSHERAIALGAATGSLAGGVAKLVGARPHHITELNLRIAFPDRPFEERDAIRRAMWRNWGRMLAEVALLPRFTQDDLRSIVELAPREGAVEIFRRAREHGSIVLTAHYGSFEYLHAGCAAHGFPVSLVHRTLPNRRVDQWLTELRERLGSHVLRRGAAAREILRELGRGKVVALPFDQRPPRGMARVFAPFFSLPVETNAGLARIALASRAAVFPAVLVRDGDSPHHRAVFGPEMELVRTGDREADVLENTRRFNRAIEDLVRARPDHWIWMYARWKRVPGGFRSPYRKDSPPLEAYWHAAGAAERA